MYLNAMYTGGYVIIINHSWTKCALIELCNDIGPIVNLILINKHYITLNLLAK